MKIINISIHPYIRVFFLVGTMASVILFRQPVLLILFYILMILPMVLMMGITRNHLRLLIYGLIPITLTFILMYIIILKEANSGWNFILVKIFKILDITSILQIALTVKSDSLYPTFRKFGLKGENLITVIGSFTVWADIKRRSEQIITARFARGFIGKRNFFNTAKQFPYILVPLIIGILRTSIERSHAWTQWNIVDLINDKQSEKLEFPKIINLMIALMTVACLIIGIYNY